jgi:hemerythrin-like domain-containing protein
MQIRTVPPDTSGTFAGPLAAVSAVHARTLQHCAALRQLLVPDAPDRQICRDIAQHFDAVAPRVHADEEAFLFPTLLESMAGSDAVCLREMTAGLTLQHRALAGLWGALRVPLTALAAGQPARLDVTAVEAFIAAQQHCIGIETLELLPMAARLFTDSELAWLHQMMNTSAHVAPASATLTT